MAADQMVETGELMLMNAVTRSGIQSSSLPPGPRGGPNTPGRGFDNHTTSISSRPPDAEETLVLVPQLGSFGFMFSTNDGLLDQGVSHYVSSIDAGSAAAVAGLSPGDRIVAVNNYDVTLQPHNAVIALIKMQVP